MFRSKADNTGVDRVVAGALRVLGLASFGLVLLILYFLFVESVPAFRALGDRLATDGSWHPTEHAAEGTFGMLPIVLGSVVVTLGAILLAAPLGVGSALFCQYYAPAWLATVYRRLVELLAGIPSVVFGFWGLAVLSPIVGMIQPPGPGLLTGVLVLALMIVPTVALVAESALVAVPRSYLVGAAALGMGRWSIVSRIALPTARAGIITGLILGVARALGETMAVVMVCGNIVRVPGGVFDSVRTLTANIALEMGYALGDHRSALFASGLLLLLMAILLVAATEWVERSSARREGVHVG